MSVKNGWQRTAKCGWIPLVFGFCASTGHSAQGIWEAGGGSVSIGEPQSTAPISVMAADTTWEMFMRWLMEQLMTNMNCDNPSLPDDLPVAMLALVDCYASGGLAPMAIEEQAEFQVTVNEALFQMQSAPPSIPLLTRIQFIATLKLMRAEAELKS